jgi:hypothetical protein
MKHVSPCALPLAMAVAVTAMAGEITLGAEAMRRASAQGDAPSADRRAPKD